MPPNAMHGSPRHPVVDFYATAVTALANLAHVQRVGYPSIAGRTDVGATAPTGLPKGPPIDDDATWLALVNERTTKRTTDRRRDPPPRRFPRHVISYRAPPSTAAAETTRRHTREENELPTAPHFGELLKGEEEASPGRLQKKTNQQPWELDGLSHTEKLHLWMAKFGNVRRV